MEREELTEREELVAEMRRFAVAAEENSEYDTMQDFDAAASMLEADQSEIASLKSENERIRQNSVSQELYQMMCEERDAAVAELKKSCNYQFGGCYLCLNLHTDLCKSCLRDDIWTDIAKNPKDNWIWHGPQKGERKDDAK